jgi:4,5:9,10-diseco-3-hydroxy-5,9,17-trioxoandrosta-1(10),2-diene-4-oate hydrolase
MAPSSTAVIGQAETSRTLDGEEYLHYHDAGSGSPLLMLHGSGPGVSGWANFGGTLPAFVSKFRVVILDQPGYGQSYQPQRITPPYVGMAAGAVLRLLDALELDRVDIIGNSMGGGVACRFAIDHPERVNRLVLMGPGGLGVGPFTPRPTEGIRRLREFNDDPTRERLKAWLETMVYDLGLLTDELLEMRWSSAMRPGAIAFSRMFFESLERLSEDGRPPLWAEAARIKHPTLIVWGRDDRVVPLDNSLLPMRTLGNGEVHVLPRCGHWAMIERKSEFERLALEFLTRS